MQICSLWSISTTCIWDFPFAINPIFLKHNLPKSPVIFQTAYPSPTWISTSIWAPLWSSPNNNFLLRTWRVYAIPIPLMTGSQRRCRVDSDRSISVDIRSYGYGYGRLSRSSINLPHPRTVSTSNVYKSPIRDVLPRLPDTSVTSAPGRPPTLSV